MRQQTLHADKGHDYWFLRAALRRTVEPRAASRESDSRERLGRHEWVVKRSPSRLNRFRRLNGATSGVHASNWRLSSSDAPSPAYTTCHWRVLQGVRDTSVGGFEAHCCGVPGTAP